MAASATFALKAGVCVRRARLLMVSPDSRVNLARRQAETPLSALFRFAGPAQLVPQLAIGVPALYLLLQIARNRVPINSLFQMILYVDAVYLLFDALAWIPLSYLYNTLLMP